MRTQKSNNSNGDRKCSKEHGSCDTFNQLAIKVEEHGLTATKERVMEYIQVYGSGIFYFAVTEDSEKMIIILN